MKKLFVLVSCFAVLLIVSNVSFAQEGVAAEAVPCTCGIVAPAFTVVHLPAHNRFAGVRTRAAAPQVALLPASPHVHPAFLHAAPDARPLAARRAARLSQQPNPFQFSSATPPPPVVFESGQQFVQVGGLPPTYMGDSNRVLQRAGGAPTINFLSIVRAPRPYVSTAVVPAE